MLPRISLEVTILVTVTVKSNAVVYAGTLGRVTRTNFKQRNTECFLPEKRLSLEESVVIRPVGQRYWGGISSFGCIAIFFAKNATFYSSIRLCHIIDCLRSLRFIFYSSVILAIVHVQLRIVRNNSVIRFAC